MSQLLLWPPKRYLIENGHSIFLKANSHIIIHIEIEWQYEADKLFRRRRQVKDLNYRAVLFFSFNLHKRCVCHAWLGPATDLLSSEQ